MQIQPRGGSISAITKTCPLQDTSLITWTHSLSHFIGRAAAAAAGMSREIPSLRAQSIGIWKREVKKRKRALSSKCRKYREVRLKSKLLVFSSLSNFSSDRVVALAPVGDPREKEKKKGRGKMSGTRARTQLDRQDFYRNHDIG